MAGPWEKYAQASDQDSGAPDTSDGPWAKYAAPVEPSMGDYGRAAMRAVGSGLSKLDSYTGAPVRAAIGSLQNDVTEPGQAVAAFRKQFGADPRLAPTGQDIARKAGVPDTAVSDVLPGLYGNDTLLKKGGWLDPTASGAAGLGLDVASNPTSYLPIGQIAGAGVRGAGKVLGLGASTAEAAADAAPVASDALAVAKTPGMAARAAGKAAETFTGVDKNLASNYAANTDRINSLIGKYSGPEGYAEAAHAADIRDSWNKAIQNTRSGLNNQIDSALNNAPRNASIPLRPIIDKLEAAKGGLNPSLDADRAAISQIEGLQREVAQGAVPGQNELYTNPQTLQRLKQIFQDKAQPSYGQNGQIFNQAPAVSNAAKGAAAAMRRAISDAVPEVAPANAKLSALHDIEDTMNSSILKDNGPVHAINRAVTNPGGAEAHSLDQLSDITGHNFAQDAKDLATSRAFSKAGFTPIDTTGKSVARQALASGVGGGLGYAVGGWPGAFVGREVAKGVLSPAGFKTGINAANMVGKAAAVPGDVAGAGYRFLSSPTGEAALGVGGRAAMTPAAGIANIGQPQANRVPARGPDAWAVQGARALQLPDEDAQTLSNSPRGKQLLIQASDLKPGSKAMKAIQDQIQAMLRGAK